jgi:hypothetical protein
MSVELPRPEGPPGSAGRTGWFAWLWEPCRRTSALVDVQVALARGYLDVDGRAALIRELEALRDSGELSPRESARVARIFRAIAAQEAGGAAPGQGAT